MLGQADHRELLDQAPRIARAAGDYGRCVSALFECRQGFGNIGQNLEALGAIEFGDQIGKDQLQIFRLMLISEAPPRIVPVRDSRKRSGLGADAWPSLRSALHEAT
jgi:hypothetical protein